MGNSISKHEINQALHRAAENLASRESLSSSHVQHVPRTDRIATVEIERLPSRGYKRSAQEAVVSTGAEEHPAKRARTPTILPTSSGKLRRIPRPDKNSIRSANQAHINVGATREGNVNVQDGHVRARAIPAVEPSAAINRQVEQSPRRRTPNTVAESSVVAQATHTVIDNEANGDSQEDVEESESARGSVNEQNEEEHHAHYDFDDLQVDSKTWYGQGLILKEAAIICARRIELSKPSESQIKKKDSTTLKLFKISKELLNAFDGSQIDILERESSTAMKCLRLLPKAVQNLIQVSRDVDKKKAKRTAIRIYKFILPHLIVITVALLRVFQPSDVLATDKLTIVIQSMNHVRNLDKHVRFLREQHRGMAIATADDEDPFYNEVHGCVIKLRTSQAVFEKALTEVKQKEASARRQRIREEEERQEQELTDIETKRRDEERAWKKTWSDLYALRREADMNAGRLIIEPEKIRHLRHVDIDTVTHLGSKLPLKNLVFRTSDPDVISERRLAKQFPTPTYSGPEITLEQDRALLKALKHLGSPPSDRNLQSSIPLSTSPTLGNVVWRNVIWSLCRPTAVRRISHNNDVYQPQGEHVIWKKGILSDFNVTEIISRGLFLRNSILHKLINRRYNDFYDEVGDEREGLDVENEWLWNVVDIRLIPDSLL